MSRHLDQARSEIEGGSGHLEKMLARQEKFEGKFEGLETSLQKAETEKDKYESSFLKKEMAKRLLERLLDINGDLNELDSIAANPMLEGAGLEEKVEKLRDSLEIEFAKRKSKITELGGLNDNLTSAIIRMRTNNPREAEEIGVKFKKWFAE